MLQHVEDEALLDGLAHAVQRKGAERTVRLVSAEQLQRAALRRRREGEAAHVRWLLAQPCLPLDRVLGLVFDCLGLSGDCQCSLVGLAEDLMHCDGCLTTLRRVRLVDDHREALASQLLNLASDDWEFFGSWM